MVLVTGGTGLVGSHLLLELVKAGESVRALKRKSSDLEQVRKTFSWYEKDAGALFDKIEWLEGDILDMMSNDVVHAFIQGRKIDLDNKHKMLYRRFQEKYK